MVQTTRLSSVLEQMRLASPGSRDGGGVGVRGEGSTPGDSTESTARSIGTSLSSVTPNRDQGFPAMSSQAHPSRGESPFTFNNLFNQVTTASTSQSQGKKYRLWCTPVDTKNVCMGLIGGSSFCTVKGCTKNHRSQKYHQGSSEEAYVARTNETAFVEPMIKTNLLNSELLSRWRELYVTLEEWSSLFSLIKPEDEGDSDMAGVKFSLEDIKVKDEEESSALAFKTPRKRKASESHSPAMLIPTYDRVIDEDEERLFTLEAVKSYINELDQRSMQLREVLTDWSTRSDRAHSEALSFYQSTDVRMSRVLSAIGTKPTGLHSRFDAPNVWLSVASVADEVILRTEDHNKQMFSLKSQMNDIVHDLQRSYQSNNSQAKIAELEKFVIESAQILNANIERVGISAQKRQQDQPSNSQPSLALIQRVEKLEKELQSVRSMNDEMAVKYANLGFQSQKDSDAWIETNLPNDDYGLLMDFNIVLEHVYSQLAGTKILPNFESIVKMKLSNNNQAVALTSFETRIPKVFCGDNNKGVGIVREGESYFKRIKTWEDWNTPNDGFRDQVKHELTVFEIGHQEVLDAELTSLSLYHTLCSKSLTDSVGWAYKLIKFIDDTYREYSRAKYSSKKAWHVATKLGVAIMEYIAKPRNVVSNSFRISNNLSVAKAVSYANFRSLDLMAKIEVLDFKNSPIVTAELAKFLALNSSVESLEVLQRSTREMSDGVAKAIKDAASAIKSAGTVGNSVDGIKVEIKSLSKRLKTLETKNA